MKKINPNTRTTYKRGDFSHSRKKRFWSYKTAHINKDGFFSMSWVPAHKFEEFKKSYNNKQRNSASENKNNDFPKRLNPKTGKPFVLGDQRADGFYFMSYNSNGKVKGGFCGEQWGNKDSYFRYRIGLTLSKIQTRAKQKKLSIDITVNYLLDIFPGDSNCPILGHEMVFGGDANNSPSIDRVLPHLGYTRGNVAWVSKIANTVKSDRTAAELRMIADWIDGVV
jgi:hypothetical protein